MLARATCCRTSVREARGVQRCVNGHLLRSPHGKLFNATSQERLVAALFFALTLSVYQQLDLS